MWLDLTVASTEAVVLVLKARWALYPPSARIAEEAAMHHVLWRDDAARAARDARPNRANVEEGTIRPDVETGTHLKMRPRSWKDIAGNLPGFHGMLPSGRNGKTQVTGKIVFGA